MLHRKAYVIEEYIKPEQLPNRLVEWKDPELKENEILIDVHYAGLNFFDILQIQGKYQLKPPFPWISGAEFSGVVAANSPIPKGCTFVPGKTRVFGAGQGSYAEKIKVDYRTLIEVPASMGLDAAAGLYVTMPTSYAALVNRARTQPGEWVLVHAAAGGGSIQKIPANLLLLKNVAAMGVHWGAYARNEPEAVPQVWKELLALFESGKVRGPVFEKVFDGLEAVPEGLRALGARETWGKAVVKVKGGREGKL
ncbi:hypothetical protein BMF94_0631 [Rhodotorula taiwanensis]|uniref:Enoyl reductase (ER) domain-containing protein n=1 Tax=Rhodotorula taiwanensis TaxID=741276 RepID=A0A2S5BI37_9BASI|nr:hypothetical protein BMF94_0631 [Rhodotorula taiwanensis]